jgi:hypothetical protein
MLLTTSQDAIQLMKQGFKMRVDHVASDIRQARPAAS